MQIFDNIRSYWSCLFNGFHDLFMRFVWKLLVQVFNFTFIIYINPDIVLASCILFIVWHNIIVYPNQSKKHATDLIDKQGQKLMTLIVQVLEITEFCMPVFAVIDTSHLKGHYSNFHLSLETVL